MFLLISFFFLNLFKILLIFFSKFFCIYYFKYFFFIYFLFFFFEVSYLDMDILVFLDNGRGLACQQEI